MFRKLGWQLTTSFVLVSLLSMALLGFYLLDRLDDLFTHDLEASIHHEGQLVSSLWGQYLEYGELGQREKRIIYSVCRSLWWQSGSRIRVLDASGNTLIDTSGENDPGLRNRNEVLMALKGQEVPMVIEPTQEGESVQAVIAAPIKVWKPTRGGTHVTIAGVVYVSRSRSGYLRSVLHDVRFHFIAGSILALIASGFVGLFLSHVISQPLRKIATAAEKMARGDMSQMVRVQSRNEIGELAQRFNFMASELQRREEQLLEEKNKLSAVVGNMAGGVLLIDAQGSILMKNHNSMEMLSVNEENPDEQSLSPLRDIIDQATSSLDGGTREIRLPHGKVAHVVWTPLRSEAEELLGFVIIMNDITELKRMDEMKTEFVTNVSHELRTPLASIKGLAEILLDGAMQKEEGGRFLRSIDREVDRLTRLVKDLLDLSKIESGLTKFDVRAVNLVDLTHDILSRMHARLETAELTIQFTASGTGLVMADSDRIQQVIINLLDNAVRYTPAGGAVSVNIANDGSICTIKVANEGVGIPATDLSRIFERFYRVDKHRSRDQGGTGLGLSIARNIVERLGGRIWAECEDRLTTFSFTLPAAPPVPAEEVTETPVKGPA